MTSRRPVPATDAAAGLRYASAAGRWVVAATVLGSGVAALDATVVGIALPAIVPLMRIPFSSEGSAGRRDW